MSSSSPTMIRDKIVLAPMVRGSELAFRQIVRRYGVKTCYSPMLRAHEVVKALTIWNEWRRRDGGNMKGPADDGRNTSTQDSDDSDKRSDVPPGISHEDGILVITDIVPDPAPVVVQLCGNDPSTLFEGTRGLLDLHYAADIPCCLEGIDLNLGCPQECALRGDFGAFLAEKKPEIAIACVQSMRRAIDSTHDNINSSTLADTNNQHTSPGKDAHRPRLSCKIRIFDTDDQTITFAKQLVEAGCELLAVHCRRRSAKSEGPPDLAAGRKLVDALPDIPVIINGAILSRQDAQDALSRTNAAGVMIASGFLINPRLLVESHVDPAMLAAEYLASCDQYPPATPLGIRRHLRWIFRANLEPKDKSPESFKDWRPRLWTFLVRPYLETLDQFRQVVALYVKLNGSEMPPSLSHQPDVTFKSIRNHPSRSKGDTASKKRRIEC